ncbi:hypothetical protein CEXT_311591 [Caerostris extrusa]|uniref:Uncharacterized protein n=1 Tax=Caerostris extrusa TaxID=172846 RepID=A0AAV4NIR0_CAEEX|nr:hypothetical protein CEXT_311591 [Caerostris extrusa]
MEDYIEMNETISVVNATEEVPERNVFIFTMVATTRLDSNFWQHDFRSNRWQCDCNVDCPRPQTNEKCHQLLSGESQLCGHYGVNPQCHLQLHLYAGWTLAIWRSLLQDLEFHSDCVCCCFSFSL